MLHGHSSKQYLAVAVELHVLTLVRRALLPVAYMDVPSLREDLNALTLESISIGFSLTPHSLWVFEPLSERIGALGVGVFLINLE